MYLTWLLVLSRKKELEAKAKELAKELVDKFEKEWKPVADNLAEAMKAFDDLEGKRHVSLTCIRTPNLLHVHAHFLVRAAVQPRSLSLSLILCLSLASSCRNKHILHWLACWCRHIHITSIFLMLWQS